MKLSQNALTVLNSRYLLRDKEGRITETPEELFLRVSVFISKVEIQYGNKNQQKFWENKFFELLSSLVFLPNSPTLMNAGVLHGQLSACYVLPLKKSEGSQETTLDYALEIQKSGGGTGFNFSYIDQSTFKGPVSYIQEFNLAMDAIKETGKRSGANMAIVNIDHPDVLDFIKCKLKAGELENFNISVGITDSFMDALLNDAIWELKDPINGVSAGKIRAQHLWDEIINAAWKTGDPGLVFLDTIERENPTPQLGKLMATNPCGEVPLLSYEACNLGSINLSLMVKRQGKIIKVDWSKLKRVIPVCIRFLDNVIDANYYSFPEIEEIVKGNRKIGLGVMGWAELLAKLGLRYDSEEAVMMGKKIMRFIQEESRKASEELAKERGPFPNWRKSKWYPDTSLRNATLNSIAPTGTISIIGNTSSSIEPFFALAFHRKNILDGRDIYEMNPLMEKYSTKYSRYDLEKKIKKSGSFTESDNIPGILKDLFKTSQEISHHYHLKHQVAFQRYTDNAVSKTINLPANATVEDIGSIYRLAWKKGLKGITIYRYGSKKNQVLYQGIDKEEISSVDSELCKICED